MSETTKIDKKNSDVKKSGGFKKIIDNLQGEFNKIVWPTKDSLVKRTIAVVTSTVALGVVISLIDIVVKYGLGFIIS